MKQTLWFSSLSQAALKLWNVCVRRQEGFTDRTPKADEFLAQNWKIKVSSIYLGKRSAEGSGNTSTLIHDG